MSFSQLPAAKKHTKNGAAVTSLSPFLFRDDFSPFYRPLLICSCTEQIQDGTFSLLMKASRDVILHGIGIFLPYGADLRGDIEVKGIILPSHVKNLPEF